MFAGRLRVAFSALLEFRQTSDVVGDQPGFCAREGPPSGLFLKENVSQGLVAVVPNDETGVVLLHGPRRWKTAVLVAPGQTFSVVAKRLTPGNPFRGDHHGGLCLTRYIPCRGRAVWAT